MCSVLENGQIPGASGGSHDPLALILAVRSEARQTPSSSAEREDLVQETLLRVWQRLVTRGEASPPRALIRTVISRTRIYGWLKARSAGKMEAVQTESPDPSLLETAAGEELRGLVRSAIEHLIHAQRVVVKHVVHEGKTFRAVSEIQRVP